jgi:hypothetical protein
MTWSTRFVAVPTGQLQQDDQVAPSAKASPEQMRAYMGHVPAVYAKLGAGARAEAFRQMRTSPDSRTRAVGDAYHHLFSPDGAEHRIEAEVVDGKGLVVTRGRHRVEAAREIGLPWVPVHVRAPDEPSLDVATRRLEADVEQASPDVVHAHRALDGEHRTARAVRERCETRVRGPEPGDRVSRAMRGSTGSSPSGPTREQGR